MSLGILTWLLCMFLDSIDGVFTWSILWALPIIAATTLVFVIVRVLYRRGKHTNHFIFIPIYICLGLAVLLPLIELIIQYNLFDRFKLTWSLVSTISLVCFSGIVAGLYYQMPEYIKERLIRIFHV
jgi:Sec-independent protein secretion pathway component TatC